MAKEKTDAAKSQLKGTRKMCPDCKATVFQGPYTRGEIVDGNFIVRETVVTCVSCHATRPVEDLADATIPG